jgi:hypothetical protein
MAATLDGLVDPGGAVFEAKFMLPWSFSERGATLKLKTNGSEQSLEEPPDKKEGQSSHKIEPASGSNEYGSGPADCK